MPRQEVAIAPFLKSCPRVITLGIRASICDYSPGERKLLASARRVFFPTPRFAKVLEAAGKQTFPSSLSYRVRQSRIFQETLLHFSGCPHPRTRIFFGRRKESILRDFCFPFLAMGPDMHDGIFTVNDGKTLAELAGRYNPLIIREGLDFEEQLWLVFVNYDCIWISDEPLSGRTSRGRMINSVDRDSPLQRCIQETSVLVRSLRLNDIAVEVGFMSTQDWRITSLGRPPVSWLSERGLVHRHQYISSLIQAGSI